jgi:hypothetical protein
MSLSTNGNALIRIIAAAFVVSMCGSALATAQTQNIVPTSAPDAVSISSRSWSGEIDDASAGHGTLTIAFAPQGGTFRWINQDGYSHVGTIRDFARDDAPGATFILHLADAVACDYSVASHIEDGHLKGLYRGCGHNRGSFDLVPSGDQDYAESNASAPRVQGVQSTSCTFTGKLLSQRSGAPIKYARVALKGADAAQVAQSETDVNGAYRFTIAPAVNPFAPVASYTLDFQASGYEPGNLPISVSSGRNFRNLPAGACYVVPTESGGAVSTAALEPVYAVTGSVHTRSRSPVKGATNAPPTPEPTPGPLYRVYNSTVAHYCKTATQVACAYYTSDAIQCFTPALNADMTYRMVRYWKKTGLSTQRAIEQMSTSPDNAIIALAAGKIIDDHDHYDRASFEMAVMQLCLAGVTK